MNFYFLESTNFNLIGIGKSDMIDPRYECAREVLEELGLDIPAVLLQKTKKS